MVSSEVDDTRDLSSEMFNRRDSTDSDGWFRIDLKEIHPERSEGAALQNLQSLIIQSEWMVK